MFMSRNHDMFLHFVACPRMLLAALEVIALAFTAPMNI